MTHLPYRSIVRDMADAYVAAVDYVVPPVIAAELPDVGLPINDIVCAKAQRELDGPNDRDLGFQTSAPMVRPMGVAHYNAETLAARAQCYTCGEYLSIDGDDRCECPLPGKGQEAQ